MTVHQTRRIQHLALRAALIAWIGCGLAQSASADGAGAAIIRVRSTDQALAALIDRGLGHSATFQRLVAMIDRSNGMVQVEAGKCGQAVRACLLIWMETAGTTRFLRVIIDRRKSDSDVNLTASIGHELQHAVEALSDPNVVSSKALYWLFTRLAPTVNAFRFETIAATLAGDAVRRELRKEMRRASRPAQCSGARKSATESCR